VHAEATSEKVALAAWLDGRATAVLGRTRTSRPPTRGSFPGERPALTDVGMTGPHDSVIGVETASRSGGCGTGMPVRFETAVAGVRLEARSSRATGDGAGEAIEPVRAPWPAT
jgi:calcineurin-like phosphoesterase